MPSNLVLRGRPFTPQEIETIKALTEKFGTFGRTRISVEVCKELGWKQPNGWLKDRACRDVLRTLHEKRLIELPESRIAHHNTQYSKWVPKTTTNDISQETVTELHAPLELVLAKGNANEKTWNAIIQTHHYLGHKVTVGKCLKFLVKSGPTILGAISLSESAWAVKDRDSTIKHLGYASHEIANNSRFLILPHIKVECLASQILSLLATEGVKQWEGYYSIRLKCLETFVDRTRFKGTSYKAGNWTLVGHTVGYRKSGTNHYNSQTSKYILLYPLISRDREMLRNAKGLHKTF